MKNIILTAILLIASFTVFSQKGVNFEDLTFNEALAKAKAENKLVFMDCCTRWCGACIQIAKNLFPLESVGKLLNENFICLKYDMEKGEGPELGKRFNVNVYPTFLIIEQDGSIRHRFIGNTKEKVFIKRVKEGLDENTALKPLATKYNAGNREKDLLFQYAKNLIDLKDPSASNVVKDLFNVTTDKEKTSEEYWFIFKDEKICTQNSDVWKYLHEHRKEFYKTIGLKKVVSRIAAKLNHEMQTTISGENTKMNKKRLVEIGKEIKALDLATEKSLLASLAITKAAFTGDTGKLLSTCEKKLGQVQNGNQSTLIYYISAPFKKAPESQKTRWKELVKSL